MVRPKKINTNGNANNGNTTSHHNSSTRESTIDNIVVSSMSSTNRDAATTTTTANTHNSTTTILLSPQSNSISNRIDSDPSSMASINGTNNGLVTKLTSGLIQTRDDSTRGFTTSSGFASSGLTSSGLASNGLISIGLRSSSLASSGLAPSGLAPSGLAPSGLAPSGLAPSGFASSSFASSGLASSGTMTTATRGISLNGINYSITNNAQTGLAGGSINQNTVPNNNRWNQERGFVDMMNIPSNTTNTKIKLKIEPFRMVENTMLDIEWEKYIEKFEAIMRYYRIVDEEDKLTILKHVAGNEVYDLFRVIQEPNDTYAEIKQKLERYFKPQTNTVSEIYSFRSIEQRESENFNTYVTRLKQAAKRCDFRERIDEETALQIIKGCKSKQLRRKLLSKPTVDLNEYIKLGIAYETSEIQAAKIESKETVMFISNKKEANQRYSKQVCRWCGGEYPHKNECPARGKECKKCHKLNHFARVCRSSKFASKDKRNDACNHIKNDETSQSESESNADSENKYSFGHDLTYSIFERSGVLPLVSVEVCGTVIKMLIDTGSTVNIIDSTTFNKFKNKPKLKQHESAVYAYNSTSPLKIIGSFTTMTTFKNVCVDAVFTVIEGNCGCILSYTECVKLNVIQITNHITTSTCFTNEIMNKFPSLFNGQIGKLKEFQLKLLIDETVTPVNQPLRRFPIMQRKAVEDELYQLLRNEIIEPATGPTTWVSPIVVVPKPNNKIRLCTDARLPNTAIKRRVHVMPTLEDLIFTFNGCKYFSKLDIKAAYHQIELHPESRQITTFVTHKGLFRYKRLNYGVCSATEDFQRILEDLLNSIEGVKNLCDDIIVGGNTVEEHDYRLMLVLRKLEKSGLTLNREKCEFQTKEIEFFGCVFSSEGVKPSEKKLIAIKEAGTPKTASEVRSLFGLANYCSRFIQDFATITKPLWELTKAENRFVWNDKHDEALKLLKESLTTKSIGYFDSKWSTRLEVDASPVGLAAILIQTNPNDPNDSKIIAYASRVLTEVESRYSQVEKEALAVVWGCERFHTYLYANEFTIVTDNRAIEIIYGNKKSKPPARIERWGLRLTPYNFKIIHKPGKYNIADYMSRNPVNEGDVCLTNVADEYINFIITNNMPKYIELQEIIEETAKDEMLSQVKAELLKQGVESSKHHNAFKAIWDELSVSTDGVILRGERVVLPSSLHEKAVKIAHEGHLGIVKSKQYLREVVWFPKMNELIENEVSKCHACESVVVAKNDQPLQMSELPKKPWDQLSLDFLGPIPDGKYLLVLIDDYTRFPIVETIKSTSSYSVIPKLDKIVSTFGIPIVIRTDNGPPFNGFEFGDFANHFGFKHRKVTPLWPQANGEAERMMRNINKIIKCSKIEKKNFYQLLNSFLRCYRLTPHSSTKFAPSKLLFSYIPRSRLPMADNNSSDGYLRRDGEVRLNDLKAKEKMKLYSDEKRRAKETNIEIGDHVIVKQTKQNKATPAYDPTPGIIIEKNRNMITVDKGDGCVTRNASFFKPCAHKEVEAKPAESTEDNSREEIMLRRSERVKKTPKRLGE